MKVLHLTTHLNTGGITTYILRLIKPLREKGIECAVLASGGDCASDFRNCGANVFEFPIRVKSELHPMLYLQLPAMIRLIRREKIELMHAHTRVTQVLAALLKRFTGCPYVVTAHGFFKPRLGRRLWPCYGRSVIAISEGVRDHLIKDHHVSPDKIYIVHNALDLDEMDRAYRRHTPQAARAHFGFSANDRVAGVIARLVEDKGHEFLIRAAHALRSRQPHLKILIVGEGKHRRALEQTAADLGMAGQIVFAGRQNDVTLALAAMDLFVLPATWREGFGLSIIEAMACGKPVIATRIPALDSLIQNQVTGLLVEPSAVEPLAEALHTLLENGALADTLRRSGRAAVERSFTLSRMAAEIEKVYRSVRRNGLTV